MTDPKRKTRPASASPATPAPARLLVCDDQKLIRTRVRQLLKDITSIRVVGEAAGGEPAVKMALELKPDVILMDVAMPDLDGIEATRRILAQETSIRILGFSADANAATAAKMFAAGAHGYLLKTGNPAELLAALQKVLAGERFVSTGLQIITTRPRPD